MKIMKVKTGDADIPFDELEKEFRKAVEKWRTQGKPVTMILEDMRKRVVVDKNLLSRFKTLQKGLDDILSAMDDIS